MNIVRIVFLFLLSTSFIVAQTQDWANLNRYYAENENLGSPGKYEKRVVFMGNSITESWKNFQPDFFRGRSYINRGISGQTTPQMLIRFRQDVIDLQPQVVVILAGINDIAENTGPSRVETIAGNIISMAELAKSNGIKVVISSILPARNFPWNSAINPPPKVLAVNFLLESYTETNGMTYLDYYSTMVDDWKGLRKKYGVDPVHPNLEGYEVMSGLVEKAIKLALESNY